MKTETAEQLDARIRSLGFEPFPFPTPEEAEMNPGQIKPPPAPIDLQLWLTISQAVLISQASESTVKRWQNDRQMVNFTFPLDGRDRGSDRHFIWKADFMTFIQLRRLSDATFVSSEELPVGLNEPSVDRRSDNFPVSGRLNGRPGSDRQMVAGAAAILALKDELCQAVLSAQNMSLAVHKQTLKEDLSAEVRMAVRPYRWQNGLVGILSAGCLVAVGFFAGQSASVQDRQQARVSREARAMASQLAKVKKQMAQAQLRDPRPAPGVGASR